ncbi:hypothetical protein [Kutzneria kofuensis]|uniref:IraD/Gp25-like domain-containing protein n=1 Tax=Kutzneria kofuensis TaxID=103725 RepID=A0A7W9KNX0_9PSEU|nr:hypothetical protein [Kutzneria kofuensis]MBB5896055.1 hypothetical protein [Kutzneria kofuensis]
MTTYHGSGLRVDDGDIGFTDGRLNEVVGPPNLVQALTIRVLTPLGTDRYDTRYGLDTASIFTAPVGAHDMASLLKLNLVRTIGTDSRVRDVRDIQVYQRDPAAHDRTWRADVTVTAADGATLDLPVELGAQS